MCTIKYRLLLPIISILSITLLYFTTGVASATSIMPAHAKVFKAIPAIGSTISQAPTTVTVFTLENINPDPNKSNLFVYSPTGDLISQGNATVTLTNPREMSISIKPDKANPNGVYVVRWITVSAQDGDPDQGAFVFTVKASVATTPTPEATITTSTSQSASTANETGGIPIWIVIVVGLIALLIGLGIGIWLGRRRTTSAIGAMRKTVADEAKEESIKNLRE